MCWTGFPVPSAEPSPKFHVYEYGVVPPLTVAVNVTGLPTVGLALTVKLAVRGAADIVMLAVVVASLALASVTLTVTVKVPFVT